LSGKAASLAQNIQATKAVCVHVRRGDYLTPKGQFLGFVGTDYYERAIALLKTKIDAPHFYVFSDDIDWCKQSLRFDSPHTFVETGENGEDTTEQDFQLMTLCRHFIIANSTFSWWAAWKGTRGTDDFVTAPHRWFSGPQRSSTDIIPSRWTVL
jgi:hypothetical protein